MSRATRSQSLDICTWNDIEDEIRGTEKTVQDFIEQAVLEKIEKKK